MLTKIKRLEQVADLFTKKEFEVAMSRIFKQNNKEIVDTKATIAEARDTIEDIVSPTIINGLHHIIECQMMTLDDLKNGRKEAKAYLAEDEWDESPIDLREIMMKIFAQA